MEVFFLENSTGEEQVIVGEIPSNSKPVGFALIEEIGERIDTLRKGDSMILWEPIATLFGNKHGFYLEKDKYMNWFVCYCHERWLKEDLSGCHEAFLRLFIDEWRYCIQHKDETWKLLYKEESEFIKTFKGKSISK